MTVQARAPSGINQDIAQPLVCLLLQGNKQVSIGTDTICLGPGDSLLITADVPMVSQITKASPDEPYLSLVMNLNPAVIAELTMEMDAAPVADGLDIRSEPTDTEVADAALRVMNLLDRPGSIPILHSQLIRELHYWLLAGRHGNAIRRLGTPDSHAQRVARAVAVLRANYDKTLPVDHLASIAGMSPSTFHHHFRKITSLSPRQFQKQLRLIEARRKLLAEGITASSAAFAVGYESVSQFTREYGRFFGLPPGKDIETLKNQTAAVA